MGEGEARRRAEEFRIFSKPSNDCENLISRVIS